MKKILVFLVFYLFYACTPIKSTAKDEKHQLEIIKMLRKYKPEIVLCNAIDDRHIDHGIH